MSQMAWLVAVCGLALAPTPLVAADTKTGSKAHAAEALRAALQKQKVEIDGAKIGDLTLVDGLKQLSKQHTVSFVVLEEEFKAQKVTDIRDKKSFLKTLDTKDLSVAQFLNVWLTTLGATYNVAPDYVEIVPVRRVNNEAAKTAERNQTEKDLNTLLTQDVDLGDKNFNEVPIFELLSLLSKQHDLSFVVREEQFNEIGHPNFKEQKPKLIATRFKGVTLYQFLTVVLDSMDAAFLVKQSGIEIVPVVFAAEVTKSATTKITEGRVRLSEPLVSIIAKDKSLNEVVTKLAKDFDLNILVLPQASNVDVKPSPIRLLNVPADKAIEAIALQYGLQVTRKGTTFLLTSEVGN
ncbi:hypothetical protein VT84_26175 [Gemmata sp. SH-PL17]|uniref:hypothetical protein n=1 Tax=Gemmata sp. SH-PL17 TaxID=1630693 RepID=UPI0004B4C4C5|nr:hypothetical protein [Gemmata sp. SH-PL17]AMV27918.1 hypothetical protein VT84_26175 [Gemmata sp. SH-PL17]